MVLDVPIGSPQNAVMRNNIYLAGVAGLVVGAIVILRSHCESFGCMGLAFMWLVWGVAYVVWLFFGFFILAKQKRLGTGIRFPRQSLLAQAALGLLLIAYWAVRNAT